MATPQKRIAFAYRMVLGRDPTPDEARILRTGVEKRLARYRADPSAAAKLIKIGEMPNDPKLAPAEIAAYTIAASTILNLDETVTKE